MAVVLFGSFDEAWDYLDVSKGPWTIYMAVVNGRGMRYNAYGSKLGVF